MQGLLLMQGANGNTTSLALTSIPEFVPPEHTEEEKKKLVAVWNKPVSLEFSCRAVYMSPRTRKWWQCLSRFGNWTAKGPIRMRMLRKATMQEKRFVRTYHVVRDENGRFWYRRGDGAVIELIFADGSNPWVRFNMTRADYGYEVNRWSKNFDLQHLREAFGIHYFLAKKKRSV